MSAPAPRDRPRNRGPQLCEPLVVDGQAAVADPRGRHVLRHHLDVRAGRDACPGPGDRSRRGGSNMSYTEDRAGMFAIGLVQASGIMRHRFAVTNWLIAAYRVVQLVGRQGRPSRWHAAPQGVDRRGGRDRHQRHVQRGSGDGRQRPLQRRHRVLPAGVGDPAADLVTLGLVVLIGVLLLIVAIGPLLSPPQRRAAHQRHLMGELANTATTSSAACACCAGSVASRPSRALPRVAAGPVAPA